MRAAIITGSIRENNTTNIVSEAVYHATKTAGWEAELVSITGFRQLFTGSYLTNETADDAQRSVLEALIAADTLIFVVPTYYKSMPGALKNFFDIVKQPEIYAGKRIAIVASNHKNQDYGARHAKQVIEGLLIFFNITAVIVAEILIQHHENIQPEEIDRFLKLIAAHPVGTSQL